MNKVLSTIGQNLLACLGVLLLCISTTLAFVPIFIMGILKLFPNRKWRIFCTQAIDSVVSLWITFNNLYINSVYDIDWQIEGVDDLKRKNTYLVIANHQSWLDIVVLHRALNRKIPMLKFFIKEQLKWVPLMGFAWWAMGCPFMKRYSRDYIAKNPHKRGKDLAATQKACELFKEMPVAIMNFVEGTRFTPEKSRQQNTPYTHLLTPKTGGIAYVINSMGEQIDCLLDVTIVYPNDKTTLWDFLCGRIKQVKVFTRTIPIPEKFLHTNDLSDAVNKAEFKDWINQHWSQKDTLIKQAHA